MELVQNLINSYGIYALIFLVALEYACFPVSSEIILPLTGAMANSKGLGYIQVVLASSFAGLLGTFVIYMATKFATEKVTTKLKYTSKAYTKCQKLFDRFGSLAVCIGRVIPICRTYIAIPAGLSKMNTSTYIRWSLAGIIVWNSILIGAGYLT